MKTKQNKQTTGTQPENKNNKINAENNAKIPGKRGRPVGSKNKVKTSRPDRSITTEPGENSKILRYSLALSSLPAIDPNNPEQMKERIQAFFDISEQFDIKPAIASLALSLGISRISLFNWLTGKVQTIHNAECFNALKTAYNLINSQYEIYMNAGKINPVAGIFLMKNNMSYQDTTNYIVSSGAEKEMNITDIAERAGLLNE